MSNQTIYKCIVLIILLIMLPVTAMADNICAGVEKILREICQDEPVPALDYLQRAESINVDCACYRGTYHGIEITVEAHPNSDRVASLLLQIPGPDRTKRVLPAVKGVIGPPRYARPKKSEYGWEWPNFRTASVHYVKGVKAGDGSTVVSLFYR